MGAGRRAKKGVPMAFASTAACNAGLVRGQFRNEFDNLYEYAAPAEGEFVPWAEYGMKVFVGPMGEEHRFAKVLKTVAYVVVDEAADGSPVVEKWAIKSHREYAR